MKELPAFSEDLIKELNDLIPEKCPDSTMTEREIWTYVGSRLVVRSLLARLEYTKQLDKKILKEM